MDAKHIRASFACFATEIHAFYGKPLARLTDSELLTWDAVALRSGVCGPAG